MATITGWDGGSTARIVGTVGSFLPVAMFSLVPSSAEDTANTLSVTIQNLKAITGWQVQVEVTSTGAGLTPDLIVTASGNVLTIADGSSSQVTTSNTVRVIVWGKPAV